MLILDHFPVAYLFEQGADFLCSQRGDSPPAGDTLFFHKLGHFQSLKQRRPAWGKAGLKTFARCLVIPTAREP